MERDFLSMVGKACKGSKDGVMLSGSVVQKSSANKMATAEQIISFNKPQQDWLKKNDLDQFSSGFQTISPMASFDSTCSQRNFGSDRRTINQFAVPSYPYPVSNLYGAASQQSSINLSIDGRTIPVASNLFFSVSQGNNMFKGNDSGNRSGPGLKSLNQKQNLGGRTKAPMAAVGCISSGIAMPQRSPPKPTSKAPQMTIFYEGVVNVYENVPMDKAQAVFCIAKAAMEANIGNTASAPVPCKVVTPQPICVNQNHPHHAGSSPCSVLSSPISMTSDATVHSASGSSCLDDYKKQKSGAPLVSESQSEHLKPTFTAVDGDTRPTFVSRPVPMARKASLARFLEKRKERVMNMAPYSTTKSEGGMLFNTSSLSGKSTTTSPEGSIPSSGENSWCFNITKDYQDVGSKPPNTNLEIN